MRRLDGLRRPAGIRSVARGIPGIEAHVVRPRAGRILTADDVDNRLFRRLLHKRVLRHRIRFAQRVRRNQVRVVVAVARLEETVRALLLHHELDGFLDGRPEFRIVRRGRFTVREKGQDGQRGVGRLLTVPGSVRQLLALEPAQGAKHRRFAGLGAAVL